MEYLTHTSKLCNDNFPLSKLRFWLTLLNHTIFKSTFWFYKTKTKVIPTAKIRRKENTPKSQ